MQTINLDSYMAELSAMYSFYRYSEVVFQDKEVRERIKEQEFRSLFATALPYLKIDPEKPQGASDFMKEKIQDKVAKDIDSGLAVLRRQILEAAHSIFEKYLCHVVRVYLRTFPEILMDIDKQIPFRTVAELRNNSSIFDHIVELEVSHFSRRSLQEKKDYLAKRLKHTNQDEVWSYEGEELWKDIDRKRQAIVHEEDIPEITQEYLLKAITYLQRIMMGIAMNAQVDQGIKFTWATMSDYVKSKDRPTLKP
jgi:hypothetical protein